MPEPDSREPWFICEAHATGDTVDRVVSIFEESLHAALEARARGEVAVHGVESPDELGKAKGEPALHQWPPS
jgi:hypothetical protein